MNIDTPSETLPRTLVPALVQLINRHSGDTMFLNALQRMCRILLACGQSTAYGTDVIERTKDHFAYSTDEPSFQRLALDYDQGRLSSQMLSGTIAVVQRVIASNAGIESLLD